jgi:hypothetical protein
MDDAAQKEKWRPKTENLGQHPEERQREKLTMWQNEAYYEKIGGQGSGTKAKKRTVAVKAAERRTRFGAVLGIQIRRSACFWASRIWIRIDVLSGLRYVMPANNTKILAKKLNCLD